MAEKEPELETREEQIARAKELYARGYRNYVVGDFNEAAEDLSRSCELYAKLYGDESEEVAVPNLFYGKTLIELAQMGENKVLALPDQEEEDDDEEGGDEEGEDEEEEAGGTCTSTSAEATVAPKESTNESNNGAGPSNAGASSSSSSEPQPGTSSSSCNGNNGNTDNGNEEANENLQFAWEALEMAAKIFRRLGVGYEEYLAETHYGLGEILMENQNCAEACRDYNIAFELFNKVEPVKERHLAEIKYKTGLCHYAAANYDASIADLQKSADYMQKAIEAQKKLEQTPAVQQLIDDLTKTREDIIVKMADVQETKQLLRSNLITQGGYGALLTEDAKGAKESSSTQADKPKANDISHLIKRKKPESSTDDQSDEASPAKKPTP